MSKKHHLTKLAGVPVVIWDDAQSLLKDIPRTVIKASVDALQEWATSSNVPLVAAHARLLPDPESDWVQLGIELHLDVDDFETGLEQQDEISRLLGRAAKGLPSQDRDIFDDRVSVLVYWADDVWDDEPAL